MNLQSLTEINIIFLKKHDYNNTRKILCTYFRSHDTPSSGELKSGGFSQKVGVGVPPSSLYVND